jgi:hypothetical protein
MIRNKAKGMGFNPFSGAGNWSNSLDPLNAKLDL